MRELMKTQNAVAQMKVAATSRSLAELKSVIVKARAESNRRTILICDCSGSMSEHVDAGQRRIDVLRNAINGTKAEIISFNSSAFVTSIPAEPGGGTNMAGALDFAAPMTAGDAEVILLSDGEPDDVQAAYDAAARFPKPLKTIFCGSSRSRGEAILQQIAVLSGGKHAATIKWGNDSTKKLQQSIRGLLSA